jgi:hypothetical protein
MTTGFHITCANKNRGGTIIRVGGPGWSMSVQDAIMQILTGRLRLTLLMDNVYHDIGVRGDGPHAFLALEPDGKPLHDLELPSC